MNQAREFPSLINPAVLAATDHLHQQFDQARPFRHVQIDHFLDDAFCRRLLEEFPRFDTKAALNENGEVGGKATQEKMQNLGPSYRQLDAMVRSQEFRDMVSDITGIPDLQYDPHYFGGGTHENRQGQDLDPHVDFNFHPISRQHRRLNLIIYLNPEWQDEWGGSLQLHRDPYVAPEQDEIVTLTPLLNRCVIFETTESSWHGFKRINLPADRQELSRKSFALYYYTDTRPTAETAEEHSTVYVERHMSPRFQPGLTLSEEDVQELKILFARRDQHMRRLYRNIQHLYGENNRLRQAVAAHSDSNALDPAMLANDQQQLQQLVRSLRSRISELEHSTSWRLTAPLRSVKRLLTGRG